MPHITEIMYQQVFNKTDSIHLTFFKDVQTEHTYPESVKTIELLIKIVAAIRRLKTEQQLSLKVALTHVTFYTTEKTISEKFAPHEQLLKGITKAETIMYVPESLKKSRLEEINQLWSAHINLDEIYQEAQS
jgi:valyl-tRNA synthetase